MNENREQNLSKDQIPSRNNHLRSPINSEDKKRYGYAILIYLMVMYVFASVVYLFVAEYETFQVTYSENTQVVQSVSYDPNGMTIMSPSDFNDVSDDYKELVEDLGLFMGYHVLINPYNSEAKAYLTTFDLELGDQVLDQTKVLEIITSDITLYWDTETGDAITVYVGSTQQLPMAFDTQSTVIEGSVTTFTPFALSLVNFIVYLFLIPGILYVLKPDIKADFDVIKVRFGQYLPAIGFGYLLIIGGTFLSNYLSTELANLFGIGIGEAVNQQIIVAALRSDGVILMFVAAVLIGPIVEELVFRKAIFGLIRSDKIALAVSTLVFGGVHLISEGSFEEALVNGIPYFVLGFIFGYLYVRYQRNIWIPTAVHILSNLFSVLAAIFLF